MDAVIGPDHLRAIEERLGDGWERYVHYPVPENTETDTYHDEAVFIGPDAPFRMAPDRVEWWRDNGDAIRVDCTERRYAVAGDDGPVSERTDGLTAAETYLERLGYEQQDIDTWRMIG